MKTWKTICNEVEAMKSLQSPCTKRYLGILFMVLFTFFWLSGVTTGYILKGNESTVKSEEKEEA